MTKKVLEFRLNKEGKWYVALASSQRLCANETREYLDVGKSFDLHCSTEPPRHDEYYILNPTGTWMWTFFNGPEKDESPWPRSFDHWLTRNFHKKAKVYFWAMG